MNSLTTSPPGVSTDHCEVGYETVDLRPHLGSLQVERCDVTCWWLAAACSAWRRALSKASSEIVIAGVAWIAAQIGHAASDVEPGVPQLSPRRPQARSGVGSATRRFHYRNNWISGYVGARISPITMVSR